MHEVRVWYASDYQKLAQPIIQSESLICACYARDNNTQKEENKDTLCFGKDLSHCMICDHEEIKLRSDCFLERNVYSIKVDKSKATIMKFDILTI